MRRAAALASLFLALAFVAVRVDARHPRPASRQSPHEEIVATARVGTEPKRTTHENGRAFEEFDIVILSARPADGDDGAARPPDVDRTASVHVVHDLSCGGNWVPLAPGDRIELKGEYVHPPKGHDLIHFTHPADASCGGKPHADGGIRRAAEPGAAAPGRPPPSS